MWWTQTTAPDGWLICDGSQVSRTTYSDLFSVIGTTFGSGDGSTTFTLPDLRAVFIRGAGSQGGYNATFGNKQDATNIVHSSSGTPFPSIILDYDKSNYYRSMGTAQKNLSGNVDVSKAYIRPYNIALTPVIKY